MSLLFSPTLRDASTFNPLKTQFSQVSHHRDEASPDTREYRG